MVLEDIGYFSLFIQNTLQYPIEIMGKRAILLDIFFLIVFLMIIGSILILMRKNRLDFFLSFILGLLLAGSVIVWGIVRTDFSLIPIWIQAGATLCLLIITAMATYATMVTAQANRELAEVTKVQLQITERQMKSKIIKDIAQNHFQQILSNVKGRQEAFDSGYLIIDYFRQRESNPHLEWSNNYNIKDLFTKIVYPPDKILLKYFKQIESLISEYEQILHKSENLLKQLFDKKSSVKKEFLTFCKTLDSTNLPIIIDQDIDDIFSMVIANSQKKEYTGFPFFNQYRTVLIPKLKEYHFTEQMEQYLKLRSEYKSLVENFERTLHSLFAEWKIEYNLTDSDIEDPYIGYV
jgi:hypothetical protein